MSTEVSIFDASVPEAPEDPFSDLNPRNGRGKHSVESTPECATRPLKRASRVVQYVVSSDEEGNGEPVRSEVPPVDAVGSGVPLRSDQAVDPTP